MKMRNKYNLTVFPDPEYETAENEEQISRDAEEQRSRDAEYTKESWDIFLSRSKTEVKNSGDKHEK